MAELILSFRERTNSFLTPPRSTSDTRQVESNPTRGSGNMATATPVDAAANLAAVAPQGIPSARASNAGIDSSGNDLAGCSRLVVSVEEVDRMIKDQVPIGSDKQKVRDFIQGLQIHSLEIGRDAAFHKATWFELGNKDPEKVAELGDRIAEFTGAVIFKAKSDGILTFDNIIVQFYIDRDGQMIGYTVKMEGGK